MSHDPRYVDDGLAELVDRLELVVAYEAWRPRYALGMYVSTGQPGPVPYVTSAGELAEVLGVARARTLIQEHTP